MFDWYYQSNTAAAAVSLFYTHIPINRLRCSDEEEEEDDDDEDSHIVCLMEANSMHNAKKLLCLNYCDATLLD